MKLRILVSLFVLALLLVGCNDDESTTEPVIEAPKPSGSFTFSGVASGTFDATLGYVNNGSALVITLSDAAGENAIVINSNELNTGTYNIPDKYSAIYTDTKNAKMYELNTGSVKIDKVSSTTITGSFTGSGFEQSLTTFQTDSTKVITINGTFSVK